MLFWCGCLEEAVVTIAAFVISFVFVVVEESKFKNEDLISPNWELIVEPEAMGFVLSVLIVVVFARPEDPNAAVMGGGGGANCGGGGTVGELVDCLVEVEEDFSCCWGEDDASLPTEGMLPPIAT